MFAVVVVVIPIRMDDCSASERTSLDEVHRFCAYIGASAGD